MSTVIGSAVLELLGDSAQFRAEMDGAIQRLKVTADAASRIGSTLTRNVTLPLVALGTAAFKVGSDFESSMSKITGLVGVASDQVDAWGKDILELAPQLGRAPRELADGLFFVTSAGFRGAEAMDVLTQAAKAASAGLGDTATIADALTSAINAYGQENLSAGRATDILTAAVREGKLEAAALAPVLGNLLPTASAMGIGFEQVAGMLAVFSRTGADAASGATSLNAIMSTLQKPSKAAADALAEAGLSMSQLREVAAGPGGLVDVMRLLDQTFGDNEEAIATLFPNVRAFRGVMNALAQDSDVVDGILQGVADSTGALDHAFGAAAGTAKFQFNAAMAEISASLVKIGAAVMPPVSAALTKVSGAVVAVANAFAKLSPGAQENIVIMGGLLLVAGPLLKTFAALITIGTGLYKTSLLLATGAKALTLAIAGLSAPVLLGVAAFAALVLAGKAITDNWDIIKFEATQLVNAIREQLVGRFSAIVESVKEKVEAITGFFATMYEKVVGGSYVPDMMDGIAAEFARLGALMVQPAQEAAQRVSVVMQRLAWQFASVGDAIADFALGSKKAIHQFVEAALRDLARLVARLLVVRALMAAFPGSSFVAEVARAAGVGARAGGGPVMGNRPYMVGERGPELFVPRSAGTVVPNYALAGGLTLRLDESSLPPAPRAVSPDALATDDWWRRAMGALIVDYKDRGGLAFTGG